MSSHSRLSDWEDCYEMINFLVESSRDLVCFYHEIGPITTFRYKGYHFYLKYNKDYFARVVQTEFVGDKTKAKAALDEICNLISEMIGCPIAYYEMAYYKDGKEKINPTIEWCLNKEIVDEYISGIVNDQLFDDGGKCLNVKLFDGRNINDSKKVPQLSLRK